MSAKPQKKVKNQESAKKPVGPPSGQRLLAWMERHASPAFWVLLLVASARIIATYGVFNHTIDEPAHVACGMEWLDKGRYVYEPQHPPLARIAAAIGPYLAGRRYVGRPTIYQEGAAILYRDNHYDRNLALARLGILPFFWLACAVVYLWGKRILGRAGAVIATFLFTFLPAMLAHGGLATTDMALTATLGAAFLITMIWMEEPTWKHAAILGVCLGGAVLSKLSALAFFPIGCAAALVWHLWAARPGLAEVREAVVRRLPGLGLVALTAALLIWAGYRFSYGHSSMLGMSAPAPEFFQGLGTVSSHNRAGHTAYLLGQRSMAGWWYYYPVVLAVKTPMALLLLLAIGVWLLFRERASAAHGAALALATALGILAFSLFTHINIGVRHILPVYFGFVLVAAYAGVRLLESRRAVQWPSIAAGLFLWMGLTSIFSHPDYLPYFNLMAGNEPEKILVDSDLDWGQDMKRLSARLHELGAREVTFNPFIMAYLEAAHGFPPLRETDPVTPSPGWNAVSLTVLRAARLGLYDQYPDVPLWPDLRQPTERVGASTLLYYVPPNSLPRPVQ
ncbi:glycosyltransferase family 39 protein [uncultured Paludibaculum sp.]|uniref:glycosyltransferase family 39 protein n=1 Tax=uncultured Paludibaculum sp. TaxID=1765020 RepID=UPI002AAAF0AA|nr:glycosyltransferase family 39 protein [uncultured Paludibaculum sp.]